MLLQAIFHSSNDLLGRSERLGRLQKAAPVWLSLNAKNRATYMDHRDRLIRNIEGHLPGRVLFAPRPIEDNRAWLAVPEQFAVAVDVKTSP